MLASSLIAGITIGALYALMALGPSLVYGLLRIIDIANIAGLVLAAYLGQRLFVATGHWWLGLLAGIAAAGTLGWLLQRLLYRALLGRSPIVPLIVSIGVYLALVEAIRLVFGPYQRTFRADVGLPSVDVAGATLSGVELLIVIVGVVTLLITWFVLGRTTIGLRLRATAQDLDTARAMGVNTDRVIAGVFVTGYGLAAVAGVLVAINDDSISPTMGDIPAYKVLAVIVLGGLGNPLGTIAAAMAIGVAETLTASYVGFVFPREAIAFILLILILLVRPQGLIPGDVARARA